MWVTVKFKREKIGRTWPRVPNALWNLPRNTVSVTGLRRTSSPVASWLIVSIQALSVGTGSEICVSAAQCAHRAPADLHKLLTVI